MGIIRKLFESIFQNSDEVEDISKIELEAFTTYLNANKESVNEAAEKHAKDNSGHICSNCSREDYIHHHGIEQGLKNGFIAGVEWRDLDVKKYPQMPIIKNLPPEAQSIVTILSISLSERDDAIASLHDEIRGLKEEIEKLKG